MLFLSPKLPREESAAGHDLVAHLMSMEHYASDLRCALDLFDLAERRHRVLKNSRDAISARYRGWLFMAARDGAITVYNFRHAFNNVTTALNKIPTLKSQTSKDALRSLKKRFDAAFPKFTLVRHSVAHDAEFAATPTAHAAPVNIADYIVSETGTPMMLSGNLIGRAFTSTVNNEVVSYTLDSEKVSVIDAIVSELNAHLQSAVDAIPKK